MQNITLKSGTKATFDGLDDSISFTNGSAQIHVDFMSEEYSFSLMIVDGTEEDEIYPMTVTSNVSARDIECFSLSAIADTELLLTDIKDAINKLNPRCSRQEAYSGL